MARSRVVGAAATVLVLPLLTFLPVSSALAKSTAPAAAPAPPGKAAPASPDKPVSDVREVSPDQFKKMTVDGKAINTPDRYSPKAQRRAQTLQAAATPPVGTVRQWLGDDETQGGAYRKDYTLRGVGDKIEVWVANDIAFLPGDCRNQIPNTTEITDAQVASLITEFDNTMYPTETTIFSTPPDRDGTNAILGPDANGNGGVYTGDGDKTVALIDNVRDDNFYDFPAAPTYIAGFFSVALNELLDRNVMTIDAFDWAHRTGANPPDEPTGDLCTSRPARPRTYEGTFAHEWQHLLQYYTDPFESIWLNEGLSDLAQTLVGYVDGTATVFDRGADSHLYCFQGFGIVQTPFNANPRDCGGAENSLNLWGEGNPNALLADYGNAYSLMLFLWDRYGDDFISRLHRDGAKQGLDSLAAELESVGVHDVYQVLHDFQTMVLVDKIIGDSRKGKIDGVPKARVTTPSLRSTVNLANPQSYDDPGAAPNGADFVPLQDGAGKVLAGNKLKSLSFTGATTLPPLPLQWTTVTDDPDRAGNSVLWSGNASNLDSTAVTPVTVPTTDPTLRFLAKYGAELGFDYAYVLVSTDGGASYTAIPGDKTIAGPLGPALNGTTEGFQPHSYDLSAYAGQNILLAFRYVSDGGVNEGGLRVDDITVGGTQVSDGSSLEPFDSTTEIHPIEVANWNVRLVGIDEKHARALQLEFNGKSTLSVGKAQLARLAQFPTVVALVAYDEPTEQVAQYAPYTLKINGVVQPGGSA